MAKTVQICIEVPDDASEESIRLAEQQGKEAAVVTLQQRGDLSIREAALGLGLSYEGYLDLLAEKGLPATSGETDSAVLEAFERWMAQREKASS